MARKTSPPPVDSASPPEPPKLWTPPAKLSDGVKKLAVQLFIECWKSGLAGEKGFKLTQTESVYRQCIQAAQIIADIDSPTPPTT